MPRVPEKENFEVGVQPFSAHFNDTIQLADKTKWYRDIAEGLHIAARAFKERQDENDRLEAQMRANQWHDYTSKKTLEYSEKQGYDALKDENGRSVLRDLHDDATQYRTSLMEGLSPKQQQYFNLYSAGTDRAFAVETGKHHHDQRQAWVGQTIKQTLDLYGSDYLLTGNAEHLVPFRDALFAQAKQSGFDDTQALAFTRNGVSALLSKKLEDLLEKKDVDGARAFLEANKDNMSSLDYLNSSNKLDAFARISNAEDLGHSYAMGGSAEGGTGTIFVRDDKHYIDLRFIVEGTHGRNMPDGAPMRNKNVSKDGRITWDVGIYQLNSDNWAEAAKLAGVPLDWGRMFKDASYANMLGKAWVEKAFLPEAHRRYGNDWDKIHAAYNCGFGGVDKAVQAGKEDWISHLPKTTQAQLKKLQKISPRVAGDPSQMTPPQQVQAINEQYKYDPEGRAAALRAYHEGIKENEFNNLRLSEDGMAGVLGLIRNGERDQSRIELAMNQEDMTEVSKKRVMDFLARGGEAKMNWELFSSFLTDDKKLAEANLGAYIDQIDQTRMAELEERKRDIQLRNSAKGMQEYKGVMQSEALIRSGLEDAGFKWDDMTTEQRARIKSYLYRKEKEIIALKGRFTKDDEIALKKDAFQGVQVNEFIFGGNPIRMKWLPRAALDPEQRWTNEVYENGGRQITEDSAAKTYAQYFEGPDNKDRYDTIRKRLEDAGIRITKRNMVIELHRYEWEYENRLFNYARG